MPGDQTASETSRNRNNRKNIRNDLLRTAHYTPTTSDVLPTDYPMTSSTTASLHQLSYLALQEEVHGDRETQRGLLQVLHGENDDNDEL